MGKPVSYVVPRGNRFFFNNWKSSLLCSARRLGQDARPIIRFIGQEAESTWGAAILTNSGFSAFLLSFCVFRFCRYRSVTKALMLYCRMEEWEGVKRKVSLSLFNVCVCVSWPANRGNASSLESYNEVTFSWTRKLIVFSKYCFCVMDWRQFFNELKVFCYGLGFIYLMRAAGIQKIFKNRGVNAKRGLSNFQKKRIDYI